MNLPFLLDSVGTMLCAYAAGPVCGAIVGASVNLIYSAVEPQMLYYIFSNILVGIIVGAGRKRNFEKAYFTIFSLGMLLAFLCTAICVPINLLARQGMTGNLWGDGVVIYMQELGSTPNLSYIAGTFSVQLGDKIVVSFILALFIRFYRKRKETLLLADGAKLLVLLFLCTGFLSATTFAQERTANYEAYVQTIYNNRNGLPGGEVNDIAQTQDGVLWLGTYSGLYKYDGSKFTFMSEFESVRNANCVYTDEEGRLWVGTNDSGVSICTNDEIVNVLDQTNGLPEDSVRSIIKSSDGYYYIGTAGAMCVVVLSDGLDIKKVYDDLLDVKRLVATKDGYVCAITSSGKLALLKNTEILQVLDSNEKLEGFTTAYFDEDGVLYVATTGQTIEKYTIVGEKVEKLASIPCGSLRGINSMQRMKSGQIFLCADNGIAYMYPSGKIVNVNTNDFDSSIENMQVDYQGNVWFASSRLGLLKMSQSITEDFYTKVGLKESVANAVTKWMGRYYIGADEGLSIVDQTLNRSIYNEQVKLFKNVRIRCLTVDEENHLWVATSGKGVYEFFPNGEMKQYDSSAGLGHDKARSILPLKDGKIAISTDAGVSILENGKVIQNFGKEDGFINTKTLCLCESQDALLAGTDGGGIAVIVDGKFQRLIRRSDGLTSDVILRIVEASDESGIYVVTSNGLNFVAADGTISQLDKFPFYDNYDIIKTGDGNLWITCSAGVYVVVEKSLQGVFTLEYELLDSKKGFLTNLTANSWNYLDSNGKMFLCGSEGVIVVDIREYNRHRISYRLNLGAVAYDGVKQSVDKEDTNIIGRDVSRVEFFPRVINYSASNPYVKIWLEGFEEEPRIMLQSELESVTYTNLPCGDYTFHLGILDNNQKDVVEQVSYSFRKDQEIYDNWWFSFYIMALLLLVTIYFAWLIVGSQIDKSLKIQRKELENMKLKQTADAAVAAGEAKDKFLALMSHDIRTPINAILGMNEMILRECKEANIYRYAQDIKGASSTLLSLVNSILDFSKIEEGKMEIVPDQYETRDMLINLIRGIHARADEKGLEFKIDVEETLPRLLYGDDVRISQVISNLLTNAVKYTQKGFVSFIVREQERREDSTLLYVEVRDSGIGIREEDMEKLFESFQRLDQQKNRTIEGTGLGMSIVSELLHLMDSKLDVQSEYGVGSKFSFVLEQKIVSMEPIGNILSPAEDMAEKRKEQHLQAPEARILVVDDNKMNLKVATGILKLNGIVPDTAMSGMEAIEMLKKHRYHMVLLDHMMPDMDGVETLMKIREENLAPWETAIIVLTANAVNGAREQYISLGFDDYMSKPIEINVLESKLSKYLPQELVDNDGIYTSYATRFTQLDRNEVSQTKSDDISQAKQKEVRPVETMERSLVEVKEAPKSVEQTDNQVSEQKTDTAPSQNEESSKFVPNEEELKHLITYCPQIEVEVGMKYCMNSVEFYLDVLTEYTNGNKADQLAQFYESKDYQNYRVLIHSVKSNSMSIGAVDLSDRAKALEFAAKEEDLAYIDANHEAFMKDYQAFLMALKEYLANEKNV